MHSSNGPGGVDLCFMMIRVDLQMDMEPHLIQKLKAADDFCIGIRHRGAVDRDDKRAVCAKHYLYPLFVLAYSPRGLPYSICIYLIDFLYPFLSFSSSQTSLVRPCPPFNSPPPPPLRVFLLYLPSCLPSQLHLFQFHLLASAGSLWRRNTSLMNPFSLSRCSN